MPYFGEIIKTEDDLWKIIAWMRSVSCVRRPQGCWPKRLYYRRYIGEVTRQFRREASYGFSFCQLNLDYHHPG